MTEAELTQAVRALCVRLGLFAFSATTYRIPGASARPGSSRGYPDYTIAGPGGILWRECKSEDGRRSMAQIRWGKQLARAGGDYDVWRPEDLTSGRIARELEAIA